ncbi:hypothetical protein [Cognatiyoonia sp. IB215182]|uniref:hypothetical protein n=1 Tax=Cognatiyoonia sp. IB215182 TaxID=3097353 RepID=UPI002A13CBF3|nr:hypothetical protein [Cognatiyoonia sp. IB215182]MDX8351566.1 hypothetical protein [Cognatiyoonia sp. IB215182]
MKGKPLVLDLISGKGALPLRLGATRQELVAEMAALGHQPSSELDHNAILQAALVATLGEEGAKEFLPDEPPDRSNTLYFVENAIEITFGADETANFIGVSQHPQISLCLDGANLMQRPARKVFDLLAAREKIAPPYTSTEVLFQSQIITLWNANPQYDIQDPNVPVWAQIGLGNAEYLSAIKSAQ